MKGKQGFCSVYITQNMHEPRQYDFKIKRQKLYTDGS